MENYGEFDNRFIELCSGFKHKAQQEPNKNGFFIYRAFSDSCGYPGQVQQALEPLTGSLPHQKN